MKGYKAVVRSQDGSLISWNHCRISQDACVVYEPKVKAFPDEYCGPLCVITNKKYLNLFIKDANTEIWECEFTPSEEKEIWFGEIDWIGGFFYLDDIVSDYPSTRLATSVTLIRRIK